MRSTPEASPRRTPRPAARPAHLASFTRLVTLLGLGALLSACATDVALFGGTPASASAAGQEAPQGTSGSQSLKLSPSVSLARSTGLLGVPALTPAEGSSPAAGAEATSPAKGAKDAISAGDEPAQAAGQPSDPLDPESALKLGAPETRRDLWARIRNGLAVPDLDTDLVRDHERWYASRPDYVERMTERSTLYLFHIVEQVERRGLPMELALLPFIESAFNPRAMSSAKASGMWQFIPSTGRDFDLKQNIFRDERRDVLASTSAALDYLERLHRMFGDWHLALAAYNWGEGNVQRAIKRNQRMGLPTDYASLNMPAETRHYVPKLQAVENVVRRPEAFGLALKPVENHPYFLSVPIQRDIDVALAARLAGLSLAEFHQLNPSLNKPVILAAGTPQVLLPYAAGERFLQSLKAYDGQLASWTAWKVPKTMRPAEAARLTGMSEATLRDINRVPPKMLVKAGSTLLVPRAAHREQDVSEAVADNAVISLAPDLPPMRRSYVRAGKRDTVASLARRLRVSPAQLAQWNRLSPSAKLDRGQKLAVYRPIKASRSRLALASSGPRASLKSKASTGKAVAGKPAGVRRAQAKGSNRMARSEATTRAGSGKRAKAGGRARTTRVASNS